ncbi:hypothetical protein JZO77_00085 [Enterococcus hulanensis]|uniref:hypothetical protein n=1 Tax=Enterococcus hulanensis TaxID=2559929 RepID=UPI001A8F62CD|nr:hypothetical protein [Enterococcus hulanensis]MBO0455145.1 hypothetical protein [Enterococcus hulanensis]
MKTKKQKELIDSFLLPLGAEDQSLYREIVIYLSELGYNPKKERSHISFKHSLHNKQIVKIGRKKNKDGAPFLALRFSACREYSQKFAEVVRAAINKFPSKTAKCLDSKCDYCAGEPESHVYTYSFSDGKTQSHCGAQALEIPNITAESLAEIKQLIEEEHEYLIKYEANT